MFIVLLKFSNHKTKAGQFMDAHKRWISQGFDDNIFVLVGSIKPASGGMILAQNITLTDLETRVKQDPFVVEDIVQSEIIEVEPARLDERLSFLKGGSGYE
ncbi:YciI family protein [Terasakiella sp.]|uniref:YciI family protein n=1 Tax=unclassified Terasakiella TaxID=2614952 RepID=UPI003AA82AD8